MAFWRTCSGPRSRRYSVSSGTPVVGFSRRRRRLLLLFISSREASGSSSDDSRRTSSQGLRLLRTLKVSSSSTLVATASILSKRDAYFSNSKRLADRTKGNTARCQVLTSRTYSASSRRTHRSIRSTISRRDVVRASVFAFCVTGGGGGGDDFDKEEAAATEANVEVLPVLLLLLLLFGRGAPVAVSVVGKEEAKASALLLLLTVL
mmetsp:Transcript_24584/g.79452  ORF Transcript_24584/g.79452 Transcript_24584/m.79452 type:complete len:206 (-) Transcript_24584:1021-1638(-)